MKLYQEWAWLWSEVTPPETYRDEADDLFEIITESIGRPPINILELGAGGGYLLHDLQTKHPEVEVLLVDSSPEMLVEAQRRNPNAKTVLGDMATIALNQQFDVVLLHDAVMYLSDRDEVQKVLEVMKRHCSSEGIVVIIPDCCRETFEERILTAQCHTERASIHLTEWHWDPNEQEDVVSVEFSVLLRENVHQKVQSHHETHSMLVLSLGDWMSLFMENHWMQDFPSMPWMHGGELFLLRPMPSLC